MCLNYILPIWLMTTKTTKETTMIKKDPFGFNKAINYDKLNDPNVLKTLEEIFKDKPMYERPEVSYKKAVNTLKRSIKR